jgi:hypothetical protein
VRHFSSRKCRIGFASAAGVVAHAGDARRHLLRRACRALSAIFTVAVPYWSSAQARMDKGHRSKRHQGRFDQGG